jgi:hypothetical protein
MSRASAAQSRGASTPEATVSFLCIGIR